jgi:hypothetical protein
MLSFLRCPGLNGGNLQALDLDFTQFDALLWMPHIDNSEDKILPRIKAKNRKLLLVSSKRCVEADYRESDVVGRLLKTRSNLGIMIESEQLTPLGGGRYRFKLLDPLGNIFCDTTDIEKLCHILLERVEFLLSLTRVSSSKVGERQEVYVPLGFLDIVRSYGDRFAEYVNAINPNRFLGNAATRCSYGFPAHRNGNRVFVSRRNVDKQSISAEDFVEVDAKVGDGIVYWGDQKPSVDAPLQLLLFTEYPQVNYIIHGHVYVQGVPMTLLKIPCGALEEFGEIRSLFPDLSSTNFAVNLKGHGCLIMARDLEFLRRCELRGRPFPES